MENMIFGGCKNFRYGEIWENSISGRGNRHKKILVSQVCLMNTLKETARCLARLAWRVKERVVGKN